MRIALSGSSGLIGTAVTRTLRADGHTVCPIVRGWPDDAPPDAVRWDLAAGRLETERLEGVDAVVHLMGRNIAAGRWTAKEKAALVASRVPPTRTLAAALAALPRPPATFVAASAIGYYGDGGDDELTEDSPPGHGFLPDLVSNWETAALAARAAGVRVVCLRFGVVLSAAGGALRQMLLPFRLGLGGRIGSGRQYLSWVSRADAAGIVAFALKTPALAGPVNAVSPAPATNAEFTRALAAALHRPACCPLPAAIARLALGEMADALLLASARVVPAGLQSAGYPFHHPTLPAALTAALADRA